MSRKGSETWGTLRVSPSRRQLLDMLFRAGGELFFSPDVGDGDGPEWYEIDAWDEFCEKRRQEFPVPAEQADHQGSHAEVEDVFGGGDCACDKCGEDEDL